MAVPLIFVVFVLVAGVFGYLSWQAQQKRMKELQLLCLNRGWTYAASEPDLTVRWNLPPFGEGDNRKARNVMSGEWQARPFTAFDYSYETESRDSKGNTTTTTHDFGIVRLGLPAYLPNLQVTDEGMFHRFAAAIGLGQDIELESEDFNRAFRVTSRDPKFASDVLTPRTMELLLSAPHLAWRIEGTDILSWDNGHFGSVQVLERLDHLSKVISGVPTFVWHDHGYDPGQAAGGTGGGSAA